MMSTVAGVDYRDETIRTLWIRYQYKLLHDWDLNAAVVWSINTILSKRKPPIHRYHPYRKGGTEGSNEEKLTIREKRDFKMVAMAFLGDVLR